MDHVKTRITEGSRRMQTKAPTSTRSDAWRARGSYFSWRPSAADSSPVRVFHLELGDVDAPTLLLVHGFPTSSIDWFDVVEPLTAGFRVCALDFPGYGFSDKPRGWGYSLERDSELIEFYLSEVVRAESVAVVAHDRGNSVALLYAARRREARSLPRLDHLVLTNGNIFLPLSNLTTFQRLVLDSGASGEVLAALTPSMLAEGIAATTFSPPGRAGDPEVDALVATFAHADGVGVLHETIQYLIERSADEQTWLMALAASSLPTTVVWGLGDTISPPRVASFVWHEYLMLKPGRNRLYFIPDANHYLQHDRPDAFVETILHALAADGDKAPGALSQAPASPLLIDCSRERMPAAADVLRGEDRSSAPNG
jgi:pimeloyl-ACP methyl ester carboxylesterase